MGSEAYIKDSWYVVHVYSGMERSAQCALQEHIEREGLQHLFGQILVPLEEVMEGKSSRKVVTEHRLFSDYAFVETKMTDGTWHSVRNISKVTGLIGDTGNRPSSISKSEVDKIMVQIQGGVERPRSKTLSEVGEIARVKEGPFTDFSDNVEEVNHEKSRLRVSMTIFGRVTPVELELGQVEKV